MDASPAFPCALVPSVSRFVAFAIAFCSSFVELNAANIGCGTPIFLASCPVDRVNGGFMTSTSNMASGVSVHVSASVSPKPPAALALMAIMSSFFCGSSRSSEPSATPLSACFPKATVIMQLRLYFTVGCAPESIDAVRCAAAGSTSQPRSAFAIMSG